MFMIGIRIIYPNPLDQSLRHDVIDVRLACSSRSDSRARGKKFTKKKNNEGRLDSRSRPPPSPVFSVYNLTRSPLTAALYYLNAWNRLMFDVCERLVPVVYRAQKDILYSVNIALVKIRTRYKIKP